MNKKSLLQNMSVAFLAQGLSMLISAIQSLLIPKVLGVYQFGFWQLYLFYVSYVGFFHFGLSSGIYLEMGGFPREQMDKESVKAQFLFGVLFQTAIATLITFLSGSFFTDVDRRFVIAATGISLVAINASTYLMNVLQCMNETKKSSVSTIVGRMSFFLPLILLMVLHTQSYRPYVIFYTLSAYIQSLYCIWHLRDFAKAKTLRFKNAARLGLHSISVGISLMLANIASMLIIGVGRFFIDMAWGIESFGKLSLMLSLISFFLAFVNQAGLVIFPALRQSDENEVKSFFSIARDSLALFLPIVYLLYFPMRIVLVTWLPLYADAFAYLALLLPICVFDSKMSITGSTYFNVLRKERVMLALNVGSMIMSLITVLIGVYCVHSISAVILGMSLVIILRSVIAERYLSRQMCLEMSNITFHEIILTILFIIITSTMSPRDSFLVYLVAYTCYLLFHKSKIIHVFSVLRS